MNQGIWPATSMLTTHEALCCVIHILLASLNDSRREYEHATMYVFNTSMNGTRNIAEIESLVFKLWLTLKKCYLSLAT